MADPETKSRFPDSTAATARPACAIDPDVECPVCAARGERVKMHPVKAHYQCPKCRYFDSCCM
jgi:transposase-like protein